MPGKLSAYRAKRDFRITSEPKGRIANRTEQLRFVIQKHAASRLHYDFRLEIDGVLKSWALPKGPSLDPSQKRLAVHVEDHPLDYIDFEGEIPAHQYGAGHVEIWDSGTWEPIGDAFSAYRAGKLKFRLQGDKLHGGWTLVRTRLQPGAGKEQWLLIKERDEEARAATERDLTTADPNKTNKDVRLAKLTKAAAKQPAKNSMQGRPGVQGVDITHAERIIDASSGLTKFDLARYYEYVAPALLPFLRNRPVYLLRCPQGVEGERFFQKHLGRAQIPGIGTLDPALDPEHAALLAISSSQGLAGAVQMGTIELHIASARADRFGCPDSMVLDLDPDPDLAWSEVIKGAQLTKALLEELGLKSFVKTSGGKGLHVVVPLARRHAWEDVTAFSEALARHLTQTVPSHFSARMGEKNRICKIYVDYLRNQKMASTVAPYSARARPGLPVSVPFSWEELPDISSAAMWTVATLPERLSTLQRDPWQGYFSTRQVITVQMRRKMGIERR